MHGIKTPQQDFALKMQEGEGSFLAGHYGTYKVIQCGPFTHTFTRMLACACKSISA